MSRTRRAGRDSVRERRSRQYRASRKGRAFISLTLPRAVAQRGFVPIFADAFRASY